MYEVAVRCSLSVSAEPTKNAPRKATDWPSKNASVKAVPFARPRPLPDDDQRRQKHDRARGRKQPVEQGTSYLGHEVVAAP
jgi:hypothetical protein